MTVTTAVERADERLTIDELAARTGMTVRIPIPADAPPTLEDKGVVMSYRIRAIVDRAFRSDLALERAIAYGRAGASEILLTTPARDGAAGIKRLATEVAAPLKAAFG